jgi:hypothetical protein
MDNDINEALQAQVPMGVTTAGRATQLASQQRSVDLRLNLDGQAYVSNFDGDKMNVWRLTSLACGGDCKQYDEMPNGVMQLKYFYCHLVEMASQSTGEYVNCIRTVLMDQDGNSYGFVSDYIAKEIDRLCQMFGAGPWNPPLTIKIKRFKTRKGMQCYSIGPA